MLGILWPVVGVVDMQETPSVKPCSGWRVAFEERQRDPAVKLGEPVCGGGPEGPRAL